MDDEQKGDRLEFSIRAKFPVTVVSRNYDSGETTSDTRTCSFQDSEKLGVGQLLARYHG
jgi:hypothetical protein